MTQYPYYGAEEKKEKTIRLISTIYKDVDRDDYIKYEDFISFLEEGKKEAFEKCPDATDMFVMPHVDWEDHILSIEFWPGRMETDEEFAKRLIKIDEKKESDKEDAIRRIKWIADNNNLTVEIKEKENDS